MASTLTKLSAVNIVLSNIGLAPVNTVDNDNPMVSMASNIVDEVSLSLQTEGWVFNTENAYPFTPDPDGNVIIPDNVLSLDSQYTLDDNPVIRQGKLYDKTTHSFKFEGKQELDVVWLFDFDDMPEAFKVYTTMRSANLFAGRAVGSAEQVKFGEREEAQARSAMIQYECEQGDYNVLGTVQGRNYRTFRPIDASLRY